MAIVTLTTDFGSADVYAAAMKGVILSMAPGTVLVDITHEIAARDVVAGALTLAQAAPFFPRGRSTWRWLTREWAALART